MNSNIGHPVDKLDNHEKSAGSAQYIGDIKIPGLLYAKTLRSTRPRAKITAIRQPTLPEGYFVVDRQDVPGRNRVRMILDDQPFFAESEVNYVGEPILLVAGPDKTEVLRLLRSIEVSYEDIEPVLTLADSEREDLIPVYGGRKYFADYHFERGDVEACFAQAVHVIEGEYETGFQEQMYMEPQGVLAICEQGRMTVHGSFQCPYYVKNALIGGLGWAEDRIRVVQSTVGGGFGGKEEYPSILAGQAACAALKTGKPVQLVLERGEDIEATTKRHPSCIHLKTALDENHKITAMSADVRINAGAYAGLSNVVLQRSIFNIAGVYLIPNIAVRGRAVATNTVPSGAFRGFGAPQAIFAIEAHMAAIARKLGVEPLELKLKNLVKIGDTTATGGTFHQPVPLPELIDAVILQSDYRRKMAAGASQQGGPRRGIGLSLFLHGCGFTGSGERDHIKATVKLHKRADGQVELLSAAVDMGQGPRTTLRKIVAEVLGLPLPQVICDRPDTDRVPDSGPTVASRTTMVVGRLFYEAAAELKKIWQDGEDIEVVRHYSHPTFMHWEDKGDTFFGDAYPAFAWGVNAVEAEIDPLTYEITVTGIWSAYDVGRAIDEKIIRGQIEGGIVQGLGYGSIEVVECRGGRILHHSMTDCIIPSALDFGKITVELIDNPYDGGPFGAKGAGELPLVGAAPALAEAVSNALNRPVSRLPVTPEYLMEAMNHEEAD